MAIQVHDDVNTDKYASLYSYGCSNHCMLDIVKVATCQAPRLTFSRDLVQDAGHVDVQMIIPPFHLYICIRVGLCKPAVEAFHTHPAAVATLLPAASYARAHSCCITVVSLRSLWSNSAVNTQKEEGSDAPHRSMPSACRPVQVGNDLGNLLWLSWIEAQQNPLSFPSSTSRRASLSPAQAEAQAVVAK